MALIDRCRCEIDALSLLSEALNFDFATKGMDEPLTDQELASFQGMLTIRDQVVSMSGKKNPTVRDFMHAQQPRPDQRRDRRRPEGGRRPAGGACSSSAPATVLWWRRPTCPAATPTSYATSCRNCSGAGSITSTTPATTLRENLGLPNPKIGAWKSAPAVAAAV